MTPTVEWRSNPGPVGLEVVVIRVERGRGKAAKTKRVRLETAYLDGEAGPEDIERLKLLVDEALWRYRTGGTAAPVDLAGAHAAPPVAPVAAPKPKGIPGAPVVVPGSLGVPAGPPRELEDEIAAQAAADAEAQRMLGHAKRLGAAG